MIARFPFCAQKREQAHVTQTLTQREKFKRFEENPMLFQGFENSNAFQDPTQLHLTSTRAPRLTSEPSISVMRPIYERRQFVQEKKLALRAAAKPNLAENEFLNHFEEFNRVVTHYYQNGKSWPKTQGLVLRLGEIPQITSHEEWLQWILEVKTSTGQDYNWFHPDWANGVLRDHYLKLTVTERLRIKSFMSAFLDYTRCQHHRHKVRISV